MIESAERVAPRRSRVLLARLRDRRRQLRLLPVVHAFWKLYGIDLPDDVLRKLYYGNALRITPGMPLSGWQQ
ncbi:MAG: hypothetical protein KFH98_10050 [Gemmatimonadetes bacterium]|nr:hypothetical protein [Gemmatimonadota bacterium]